MNMQTLLRINVYSKDRTLIPLHPVTNRVKSYAKHKNMSTLFTCYHRPVYIKLKHLIRRGAFTNRVGNVVKTNSVKIAAKTFVTF